MICSICCRSDVCRSDVKDLFAAVRKNCVNIVQKIIENDRLLMFEVDQRGQTGMHVALRRGFHNIASFMVLKKGPINKVDNRGCRPIDIAVQNSDIEMCRVTLLLLDTLCCRL